MLIEDVKLTTEQVKEFIISKAPKFYKEFIQKGIKIYRVANSNLLVDGMAVIPTRPTRSPIGLITKTERIGEIFDMRLSQAGIANRYKHALYTASNDKDDIQVLGRRYYCIPLGDYKYCYQKDIIDFNFMKRNHPLVIAFTVAEWFTEDVLALLEQPLSPEQVKEKVTAIINPNDNEEQRSYVDSIIEKVNNIQNIFSVNHLNKLYTTDSVEYLKNNSVEVLFNCDKYLLLGMRDYNLIEMFGEYYNNEDNE